MTEKIVSIEGPMFSSKTLELIKTAETLKIGGKKVQVFKPVIDDRGEGLGVIKSRFGGEWPAISVNHPYEIVEKLEQETDVVIVDEVQFLGDANSQGDFALKDVFKFLVGKDIQVIFAGLPRDFRREPFGPMRDLVIMAQEKRVLTAVCDHLKEDGTICDEAATETQRFVDGSPASWNDPVVLVGDIEEGYAARCIEHHKVRDMPKIVFESD